MNKLLIYTNVKFYLIYIHCVMIMGKCMFVSVTLCESNNCPFLSWSFKKYFYIFTFYTFKNTEKIIDENYMFANKIFKYCISTSCKS